MWEAKKSPCCYVFKKHNIYKSKSKPFFGFYGKCTECGAKFTGTCKAKPSKNESGIKIKIQTIDTSNIPHEEWKKRPLAGDCRTTTKSILRYTTAKHFKMKKQRI